METNDWKDIVREMSECEHLFLRWIGEPEENRLRLVVEEAHVQVQKAVSYQNEVMREFAEIFQGASPIESDADCRSFEIVYNHYISYTVTNESYGKYPQSPEAFTGKLFREFQWSYLLEWARKVSYASDEHPGPGPLQHHEIVCLNHVLDVITTEAPIVRLVDQQAVTTLVRPN